MVKIENPAYDYEKGGAFYNRHRKTDPHIAQYILKALGKAQSILNVGGGAGSYEPEGRQVIAIEPSFQMRQQRRQLNKTPAIIGSSEYLPFDDKAFDASMSILSVHHWRDLEKGISELRRVTRGPVVLMTYDPDALDEFWNVHYFPELIGIEKQRYPKIDRLTKLLGQNVEVQKLSIPLYCEDGFQEAFYGRPEAFLSAEIRKSQSAWGFLPAGKEEELVQVLKTELENGEWDRKYGYLRTQPYFNGALRLLIAR